MTIVNDYSNLIKPDTTSQNTNMADNNKTEKNAFNKVLESANKSFNFSYNKTSENLNYNTLSSNNNYGSNVSNIVNNVLKDVTVNTNLPTENQYAKQPELKTPQHEEHKASQQKSEQSATTEVASNEVKKEVTSEKSKNNEENKNEVKEEATTTQKQISLMTILLNTLQPKQKQQETAEATKKNEDTKNKISKTTTHTNPITSQNTDKTAKSATSQTAEKTTTGITGEALKAKLTTEVPTDTTEVTKTDKKVAQQTSKKAEIIGDEKLKEKVVSKKETETKVKIDVSELKPVTTEERINIKSAVKTNETEQPVQITAETAKQTSKNTKSGFENHQDSSKKENHQQPRQDNLKENEPIKFDSISAKVEQTELPSADKMALNSANTVNFNKVLENVEVKEVHTPKVLDQVKDQIASSMDETNSKVNIILSPENLGKVSINLASQNGTITAEIVAENSQVKDELTKGLEELKEKMLGQGINVENVVVKVKEPSSSEKNEHNPQQQDKQNNMNDNAFFSSNSKHNPQPEKSHYSNNSTNRIYNQQEEVSQSSQETVQVKTQNHDGAVDYRA